MEIRKCYYGVLLFIIIGQFQFLRGSNIPNEQLNPPELVINSPAAVLPQVSLSSDSTSVKTRVFKTTTIPMIQEKDRVYMLIFNNLYHTDIEILFSPLDTFPNSWVDPIFNTISTYFGLQADRFKDLKIQANAQKRTAVSFTLIAGNSVFNSVKGAQKAFEEKKTEVKIKIENENTVLQPLVTYCSWDVGSETTYDSSCKQQVVVSNYLLALLVIPILVFLILLILALVWFFKYKRPKDNSSVTLNEMGYVENVSKFGGTVSSKKNTISGLSMANSTIRNQVYTSMGENYGFSVDNADFSAANLDEVTLN